MSHIKPQELFLESLINQSTVIRGGSATGMAVRKETQKRVIDEDAEQNEVKTVPSIQAAIAQMKQKLNLPYKTIENEATIHDRDLVSLLERLEHTLTR